MKARPPPPRKKQLASAVSPRDTLGRCGRYKEDVVGRSVMERFKRGRGIRKGPRRLFL